MHSEIYVLQGKITQAIGSLLCPNGTGLASFCYSYAKEAINPLGSHRDACKCPVRAHKLLCQNTIHKRIINTFEKEDDLFVT